MRAKLDPFDPPHVSGQILPWVSDSTSPTLCTLLHTTALIIATLWPFWSPLQKLQLVHNSAAQIIIAPILQHLHWLPVSLFTFCLFSSMRSRVSRRFSNFSFSVCQFNPSLFYLFCFKFGERCLWRKSFTIFLMVVLKPDMAQHRQKNNIFM